MTSKGHFLVLKLLGDVSWGAAGDFNPSLGEETAGGEDENDIENCVEGVGHDLAQLTGRGNVVSQTGDGNALASHLGVLPLTEEFNEEVGFESSVEKLGEEIQI